MPSSILPKDTPTHRLVCDNVTKNIKKSVIYNHVRLTVYSQLKGNKNKNHQDMLGARLPDHVSCLVYFYMT